MLILLIFLIGFPAIIWILKSKLNVLSPGLIILLRITSIFLIILCIWIIFEFSYVQAGIASHITDGTVTSSLTTTMKDPYHPATSDTVYSFAAANPDRQWVFKAAGYGLIGLIIVSTWLSFSGLRKMRNKKR